MKILITLSTHLQINRNKKITTIIQVKHRNGIHKQRPDGTLQAEDPRIRMNHCLEKKNKTQIAHECRKENSNQYTGLTRNIYSFYSFIFYRKMNNKKLWRRKSMFIKSKEIFFQIKFESLY